MSETPRTDAMQIFLWQHDETGRTCWKKTSPGPRWNRVGVPALCLLDDARQLERDLTAERERADRLIAFLADDALAMTYQSLAQYRQAAIDSARRK